MAKRIVPECKTSGLIFFGLLLTCLSAHAQELKGDSLLKDGLRKEGKNEIAMSTGPFYSIGEGSVLYGLMIQYIRKIRNSRFGLGLGYEKLWDRNKHSTVGLVGVCRPVENLAISALVGVTYLSQPESNSTFGVHTEIAYRVQWKYLLVGPFSELGYSNKSAHVSIGIKAGLKF